MAPKPPKVVAPDATRSSPNGPVDSDPQQQLDEVLVENDADTAEMLVT